MRLHVDHIDLYLLRRVDPGVPLEESWGALAEQVWAGKIRMLGLPVVTVQEARDAEAVHEAAAMAAEVSLFTRCGLDDVVPYAVERRIALLVGAPLGRGLLVGALSRSDDLAPDDWRRTQPRFAPRAIRHNFALTQAVAQVAARHEATSAQVALAWLLRLGDHVVPLPGTSAPYHLAENLDGDRIRLTEQDLTDLEFLPYPAGAPEV